MSRIRQSGPLLGFVGGYLIALSMFCVGIERWAGAGPEYFGGAVGTASLIDGSVTYAKIQNVADDRILGTDSGPGVVEELSLGSSLGFSAANTIGITDVELTSIAGLTSAADKLIRYTGSGTADLLSVSSTAGATTVPISDGSAKLDTWISSASQSTSGIGKAKTTRVYIIAPHNTTSALTNVPVATTVQLSTRLQRADLTGVTACRGQVNLISGALAGMKLGLMYSTDGGSTKAFFDGSADGDLGSEGPQVSLASTGVAVSSGYTTLTGAAAADITVVVVSDDGDAAADPAFALILLECY